MHIRTLLVAGALATGWVAAAEAAPIDLSRYLVSTSYSLPEPAASEASAVTYNRDNGNLFVLGDEGEALLEVTRDGTPVSTMTLTGFDDTEGLTYIGGGQFVLVEERLQDAFLFTYAAGGSLDRTSLPSVSLGPTIGNEGLEGLSYDPSTDTYFVVKEKDPQAVYQATFDFIAGTATVNTLIGDSILGVDDLSDVQVLPTGELLIYSQESERLLVTDLTGTILSEFDFSPFASNAEGVTVDENGVVYIVGEEPRLFVLTQIPEPGMASLLAALSFGLCAIRRQRKVGLAG